MKIRRDWRRGICRQSFFCGMEAAACGKTDCAETERSVACEHEISGDG